MSDQTYRLYAWPLSLYSGKTRAYLRYKGIHFVEKSISLFTFAEIKKHTGAKVMPVVVTPEGEWLQDSSHIIDVLEARFPSAPVLPATPRQRMASMLLEAWGDEFWLPSAMHYRWNFPENYKDLFEPEAGKHLLPFAPRFARNAAAEKAARLMRSYLPLLGVVPAQLSAVEAWTTALCDALDSHFAHHRYLLGSKPCTGDFGLIGPLFAHLGRDPYPARTLIAPRKHLQAWVARMQRPEHPRGGHFLPDDEVPASLGPMLDSVFQEFLPCLQKTLLQVQDAAVALAPGQAFKRSMGSIEFPLGGTLFRRNAMPYSLWMAQRALDGYRQLSAIDRKQAGNWLEEVGGSAMLDLAITPRLARRGLHVLPEAP